LNSDNTVTRLSWLIHC